LVPPVLLSTCFLVVAGYRTMRFTFMMDSSGTRSGYSEYTETLLVFGIAMFVWLVWERLRGTAAEQSHTAAPVSS
jgi:hypothetical protein